MFAEPLSTVYNSDVAKSSFCEWLHWEFHLQGAGLTWSLKNPNRSYFSRRDESVFRSSHVPWPGALPSFFKQLRGVLISKDVAASDAMLPVDAAAVCLLEVVLELMHLQYPLSLIRCSIQST